MMMLLGPWSLVSASLASLGHARLVQFENCEGVPAREPSEDTNIQAYRILWISISTFLTHGHRNLSLLYVLRAVWNSIVGVLLTQATNCHCNRWTLRINVEQVVLTSSTSQPPTPSIKVHFDQSLFTPIDCSSPCRQPLLQEKSHFQQSVSFSLCDFLLYSWL